MVELESHVLLLVVVVVPVGSLESQQLMKVTRTSEGYTARTLGECRFVPLIGDSAWPEEHSA